MRNIDKTKLETGQRFSASAGQASAESEVSNMKVDSWAMAADNLQLQLQL